MSDIVKSVLAAIADRWIFFGLIFLVSLGILRYRTFRFKFKKGTREIVLEAGEPTTTTATPRIQRELPLVVDGGKVSHDVPMLPQSTSSNQ